MSIGPSLLVPTRAVAVEKSLYDMMRDSRLISLQIRSPPSLSVSDSQSHTRSILIRGTARVAGYTHARSGFSARHRGMAGYRHTVHAVFRPDEPYKIVDRVMLGITAKCLQQQ